MNVNFRKSEANFGLTTRAHQSRCHHSVRNSETLQWSLEDGMRAAVASPAGKSNFASSHLGLGASPRFAKAGRGERAGHSKVQGGFSISKPPLRLSTRTAAVPLVPPEALVFDLVTVSVMPLYAAMMFAPRSKAAKAASSYLVLLLGSLLYVALMAQYGAVGLLVPFLRAKSIGDGLGLLANLMQNGQACSISWLHLLLVDLFQARFVYVDCVAKGLPSALRVASLGLCFMVAPIGVMFHVISSVLYAKLRPNW